MMPVVKALFRQTLRLRLIFRRIVVFWPNIIYIISHGLNLFSYPEDESEMLMLRIATIPLYLDFAFIDDSGIFFIL
jgi:hypothetical protein